MNKTVLFLLRDQFYQYGEIRSLSIVPRQQCAFIQYVSRHSAEQAAEKSFNKVIIKGRRLNIKWGRAQAQQQEIKGVTDQDKAPQLAPVPGLPPCEYLNF